jgi:hypothetical protein
MQRSAAKPTNTPSTPSTPAGPPSKRQRLSTGSSFPATTSSDYEAVRAALAAEELKRAQAIERQAAEAGETRWVLSFRDPEESGEGKGREPALKVVSAGFAVIDAVGDGELSKEKEGVGRTVGGRRRFGKVEVRFVHPLPHLLFKALLKRLLCMGEFDCLWVLMCYRNFRTQLPRLSLQIQTRNFQKTTTTILMTQLQA